MRKMLGATITVSLLLSVSSFVLFPLACNSEQAVINIPQTQSADKGNPKLDSQLYQLVSAETHGETASFAERSSIKLVDGAVRVIIECVPGQLEAATEAATNAGAKLETSHDNLLQVVVPITKLRTLADAASIRFIRLPQYPLPAVKGEADVKPN